MKRRAQPSPDAVPDFGADGPASLARPSTVRAVEPAPGFGKRDARECHDVLAIDRLRLIGWLTEAEYDAAVRVNRVGDAAGVGPGRTVGRFGGAIGKGEPTERQRTEWLALMQQAPAECQPLLHATCVADQWPTSPQWLATLRRGLRAIAREARRAPRQPIRAAWAD